MSVFLVLLQYRILYSTAYQICKMSMMLVLMLFHLYVFIIFISLFRMIKCCDGAAFQSRKLNFCSAFEKRYKRIRKQNAKKMFDFNRHAIETGDYLSIAVTVMILMHICGESACYIRYSAHFAIFPFGRENKTILLLLSITFSNKRVSWIQLNGITNEGNILNSVTMSSLESGIIPNPLNNEQHFFSFV